MVKNNIKSPEVNVLIHIVNILHIKKMHITNNLKPLYDHQFLLFKDSHYPGVKEPYRKELGKTIRQS
jgi:hypothetical protein